MHETVRLLQLKPAEPQNKLEQLTEHLHKSKRKQFHSNIRSVLYGNASLRKSSLSAMFIGLQLRKNPTKNGSLASQAEIKEESKAR